MRARAVHLISGEHLINGLCFVFTWNRSKFLMVLSNKENIIPFEWFFNAARECLAQLWQYLKCWYNEKKLLRVGQAIYCDIFLNALRLVLYVHIKSDKSQDSQGWDGISRLGPHAGLPLDLTYEFDWMTKQIDVQQAYPNLLQPLKFQPVGLFLGRIRLGQRLHKPSMLSFCQDSTHRSGT